MLDSKAFSATARGTPIALLRRMGFACPMSQ
jgi:hypothetical protein